MHFYIFEENFEGRLSAILGELLLHVIYDNYLFIYPQRLGQYFINPQALRRHYIGNKHGILQPWIEERQAEMRARGEQPYCDKLNHDKRQGS